MYIQAKHMKKVFFLNCLGTIFLLNVKLKYINKSFKLKS